MKEERPELPYNLGTLGPVKNSYQAEQANGILIKAPCVCTENYHDARYRELVLSRFYRTV